MVRPMPWDYVCLVTCIATPYFIRSFFQPRGLTKPSYTVRSKIVLEDSIWGKKTCKQWNQKANRCLCFLPSRQVEGFCEGCLPGAAIGRGRRGWSFTICLEGAQTANSSGLSRRRWQMFASSLATQVGSKKKSMRYSWLWFRG